MPNLKSTSSMFSSIYRVVEIGLIVLIAYFSLFIRFEDGVPPNTNYWILIFGACTLYGLLSGGLHRSWRGTNTLDHILALSKIWGLVLLIAFITIVFTQTGTNFSRQWLATWGIVTWLTLLSFRLVFTFVLQLIQKKGFNTRYITIIGDGDSAENLSRLIALNTWSGYVLRSNLKPNDFTGIKNIDFKNLDEIWITLPVHQSYELQGILQALKKCPIVIKFAPDLFMFRLINLGVSEVLGTPMLNLTDSPFVGSRLILKTLEDYIFSILILTMISPLMLALAIGIKFTSPGPIFYRQKRVGLNGRSFMMLKFRSMPADIEKAGAVWGKSDSKVIHPFSAFIRKYNLDELPQFLNVLMGQMSIVGPRPERTEFIKEFQEEIPNYMKKHLVKAGITGWAQVHGLRGDTDLRKRIEFDLFYIEEWSIGLDLKIIAMTVLQTIFPIKYQAEGQ